MKNRIKKIFSSRQFKNGSYTSVITVVIIAIIIVINMLFSKLPSSYRSIDISSTNIYNISDTTKEFLSNLENDIDIIVIAQTDSIDKRIEKFLDVYSDCSDKIKVSYEDPVLYPSVLKKYDTQENSIVVSCEATGRQDVISFDDIIVYDASSYYYTGSYSEKEFDGDGQLTSAINLVSNTASRKIYTVEGHAEETLGSSISSLIEKSNYAIETVNLFKDGSIPDDCELLLINSPAKDFSEDEMSLLNEYMQNGGNVIYIINNQAETPNLDSILSTYGMQKADGDIADTKQCYMGNPYYLIPTISKTGVTSSVSSDSAVLLYNAAGVTEMENMPENVSVSDFLTTSSNGFAVTENGQKQGTYMLGAVSVKDADTDNESRLTVFTTSSIINENLISGYSNIANGDVFLNAITANSQDGVNISVAPVSLTISYNTVTNQGFWGIWMVIVIPLVMLVYGFIRWMVRRKL